jgi:hypothetical protein
MSQTDLSLLDSKQFAKAEKCIGLKNAKEILSLSDEELNKKIVYAEMQVADMKAEKEANDAYISAKSVLKELNAGEKETAEPLKAVKNLCLAVKQSRKAHA